MAPIRVGFLGLSKDGWARGAHLPYLEKSENYQIVAICNSSVASSTDAIKLYNLPEETRAYGDPEELAKDKDIDLVVCSVRVDRHLSTISPALRAGKNVYVEWPLGKNLAEAEELLKLKNDSGVKKAVVGLQAREAPIIAAIKKTIQEGRIGNVLSSEYTSQAWQGGESTVEATEYLGRREVGGNLVTIHFGHAIDYVQNVLGYGFQPSPKSLLANRRKTTTLTDANGMVLEENHPKPADDTIFLHGTLSTGIPLSFSMRGGAPFKDTPGLDWRIYGETGEIRLTASGPFVQIGYPDMKAEVYDFQSKEVRELEVGTDEFAEFGFPGRNVARVYKALADGEVVCSFEDGVERHRLIDQMYKENGIDVRG